MTTSKNIDPVPPLALWGGLEATVNRVRDRYFSQMEQNGHDKRIADLDRFAALGIKALRYPVLWELVAPNGLQQADWSWPDERLPALRDLGITPIVGLVHHGSGPRDTSLPDPAFADKLAAYAGAVAAAIPGSSTTRRSTNRAPPRASAPCTACGIHTSSAPQLRARPAQPVQGRGAGDAGHPPGQSGSQTGANG